MCCVTCCVRDTKLWTKLPTGLNAVMNPFSACRHTFQNRYFLPSDLNRIQNSLCSSSTVMVTLCSSRSMLLLVLPVEEGPALRQMECCSCKTRCCFLTVSLRASERRVNSGRPDWENCCSNPQPPDEGEALSSALDSGGAKPPTDETED